MEQKNSASAAHRILVANRGEIAVRVLRAAQELGWETVAVAAAGEPQADHLRHASAVVQSPLAGAAAYLDIDSLITAARSEGCNLLHPGYGFLSESANLARACKQVGIGFVGPTPDVLELLGSKEQARSLAVDLGIPVPVGSEVLATPEEAVAAFQQIGGPILFKAVAGGGGRGIRPVTDITEVVPVWDRCRSEAQTWFGDGRVFAEKMLPKVRHVEVQILGDGTGDVRLLGDRECSLQRRRQKLIEFAPAFGISGAQRTALFDAAERMARNLAYRGLGTVEFLVGAQDFWFMEVNPRIQVEHTVTEEMLDMDLVALQLRIAAGERLARMDVPDRPAPRKSAVQLRINAETLREDGSTLPGTGVLTGLEFPSGRGVRIDTALRPGSVQGLEYDALMAKLILSAPVADHAGLVHKAYHAACDTHIDGVENNLDVLRNLLACNAVKAGEFTTLFVDENLAALVVPGEHRIAPRAAQVAANPAEAAAEDIPAGQIALRAESHCRLIEFTATPGQTVLVGQPIGLSEAMKMEHVITVPKAGTLTRVLVAPGDVVRQGQILCLMEPDHSADASYEAEAAPDPDLIRPDLARVNAAHAALMDAARPDMVARRRRAGQRTARENIAQLCDPDSFLELGGLALAAQRGRRSPEDLKRLSPADGLITGTGLVNGDLFSAKRARCAVMAYDYTVFAGTQGTIAHLKKHRIFALVEAQKLPLVMYVEGGGGRPGDTDDHGQLRLYNPTFWWAARLNALVPVIAVVSGRCFAGNAALAACAEVVIATRGSSLGMGGPAMVEGGGLGQVAAEDIGPAGSQAANGVVDLLVEDEQEATEAARRILAIIQGAILEDATPDQRLLRHVIPEEPRRAYKMREVLKTLCDEGSVIELGGTFGVGIITALARVGGRPLAVIANNPAHLSGALDADASRKAARFYRLAERFRLPMLKLCDTPGFMVGPEAEAEGLVRAAGDMFSAGAQFTQPQFTVIVRKCYGLGALAMVGGYSLAQSFTVAWPTGHFGKMGLEGLVRLGYRAEMQAIVDPQEQEAWLRARVGELYDQGDPLIAASYVTVDSVIDPAASRDWIITALQQVEQEGTNVPS